MAIDQAQGSDNGVTANERAGLGGDFTAKTSPEADGKAFQQAVKLAQAAPVTAIPGAPPLVLPEQYIPGTEKNRQLTRETINALEYAYGNFRENSRHIGQLIESGQYGEAAKQMITGMEYADPSASFFIDTQSRPALNDWSTAFGDKELEAMQRSAPDMPDTTLEGFPGERLPPPPPMITPAEEAQPQITWTPIPEEAKPEAIGGGYSAPEVTWALPGFTPVEMPVDSHILKSEISDKIEAALNSSDPDIRLEGEVAKALRDAGIEVIGFQKPIGPNASIGEIDVETRGAIIEVTKARSGKLRQIKDHVNDKIVNPESKQVILYAPNYQFTAGKDILAEGANLEKNIPALIKKVQILEGN